MTEPEEAYYTQERWQNWLDRLEEEEIDLEGEGMAEDTARLLWNLQDDAAIAVAKVLTDYEEGDLDEDGAVERIEKIQDIVLSDPGIEDEDTLALLDGVQTSMVCVFYSAQEYVVAGAVEEGTVEDYVHAAVDAAEEDDLDAALGYLVQAGTQIVGGADFDVEVGEEVQYPVSEWLNGLDSLQDALAEPEVVEEEDKE
ncbi:MAG: DUF2150 family protein [Haloferacaceae archaeon]